MTMAVQVRETFANVFDDLLVEGADLSPPLKDLFGLLVIFNSLERVADRAKNVCEETVFAVTGQTKQPKRYRILFVDERNSLFSPLAETFARRAFPESGDYTSAGWNPAKDFSEAFTSLIGPSRLDPRSKNPVPLDLTEDELGEFHVIVSLQDGIEKHIPNIPFQTILLRWKCEPEGIDQSADPEHYRQEVFEAVAVKVRELIEALRGKEAP
jgi:protein-tyrosine-phosphatase